MGRDTNYLNVVQESWGRAALGENIPFPGSWGFDSQTISGRVCKAAAAFPSGRRVEKRIDFTFRRITV